MFSSERSIIRNPEVRFRFDADSRMFLRQMQAVAGVIHLGVPEFAGFTADGSRINGQATSISDLDSYWFCFADQREHLRLRQTISALLEQYIPVYTQKTPDIVFSHHGNTTQEALSLLCMTEEEIRSSVRQQIEFGTKDTSWYTDISIYLPLLFLLGIGKGVYQMRSIVLSVAQQYGEAGDEFIRTVLSRVQKHERDQYFGAIPYNGLPSTVRQAKHYFTIA